MMSDDFVSNLKISIVDLSKNNNETIAIMVAKHNALVDYVVSSLKSLQDNVSFLQGFILDDSTNVGNKND